MISPRVPCPHCGARLKMKFAQKHTIECKARKAAQAERDREARGE